MSDLLQPEATTAAPIGRNIPPSPAPTTASFKPGDDSADTALSTRQPGNPTAVEFITREVTRDTPATPGIPRKVSKATVAQKRSMKGANYYGEVFAVRDPGPVIPQSAGVLLQLKTNVILENEFVFAKAVSEMIAKRYARPEESVCVSIDHSACMIMGGSFDGTYSATITSVSMISPTVNKRNAAVISEWLNNHLGVPANRGYIRFVDTDFANFAVGGYTVLDLMEKEEVSRTGTTDRSSVYREQSMKRSLSRAAFGKDKVSEKTSSAESGSDRPPQSRLTRKSMFNLFTRSRSRSSAS